MESVFCLFLNEPYSRAVITEFYETVKKSSSSELGKMSIDFVKRYISGPGSVTEQLFKGSTVVEDLLKLLEILSIFERNHIVPWESITVDAKVKLCHGILLLAKKSVKDSKVIDMCILGLSARGLLPLVCHPQVLDLFCETSLSVYSSKSDEKSSKTYVMELFFDLLQTQMDRLVIDSSLSNFRTALTLINFGFVLIKLAPDDYIPRLHILSAHLQQASGYLGVNGHPKWNEQIDPSELFKFPMTKLLRLLFSVLQSAPIPVLSILKSLLSLIPQLAIEDRTFKLILEILMYAVRLGPTDTNQSVNDSVEQLPSPLLLSSDQNPQSSVCSLRLLVKLTDIWDQAELPTDRVTDLMNQLFDLLRVFPGSLEHAEVRLRAWWHFICRLPRDLLTDGFGRFVSPFLANMLGRYLSLSAPLGDPQLHRYRLSQGNAYEGNPRALELSEHVFASFFQIPLLDLRRLDSVPSPRIEPKTLAQNSYQLLVALYYWIRLICGAQNTTEFGQRGTQPLPGKFHPTQPVDQIWTGCVQCLLEAAACLSPGDYGNMLVQSTMRSPSAGARVADSVPLMALQRVVHTTGQLICPSAISSLADQRHAGLKTGEPAPSECLNIMEAIIDLTVKHPVSKQDRSDVLFDLCVKSLELGNSWILPRGNPDASKKITSDILSRWCNLTQRLIDLDTRFDVTKSAMSTNASVEMIPLIRQLLSAFIPDCVNLAAASPTCTDLTSQDSSVSIWLGQIPVMCYSPEGLRLWSALADRFTRLIVVEQRVCENDPISSPDLTTIQAMLLAVFWFAGPTAPHNVGSIDEEEQVSAERDQPTQTLQRYLSAKDELAAARRLSTLFAAFHQEACLLTTVAANSWIDQLSQKLVTAISAVMPDVTSHINLNLLGRFLRCLSVNAERLDESMDSRATFNPFTWKSTQERPFGYLTGLVLALRLCLLHSPWFDPPNPSKSSRPPKRRGSSVINMRILSSPPPIAQLTQCSAGEQIDSQESCSHELSQSQSTLIERVQASGNRISCGLIESLEAVSILTKEHLRSTEMVAWLVETLSPALLRLANCCIQAETSIQDEDTELDEPLLITQRRQQAKQALEEIFVALFRWAKVQPIVFPDQNPSSVLQLTSSKGRAKVNSSSASMTVHHISGLLRSALVLSGIRICPIQHSPKGQSTQLNRSFISWLVGFWNALQDAWLVTSSAVNSKCKVIWDKRSRDQVHSILQDYEQPFLEYLCKLNKNNNNTSGSSQPGAQSQNKRNGKERCTSARGSLGSARRSRFKVEEGQVKSEPRPRGRSSMLPSSSSASRSKELDADGDVSLAALKQEIFASQINLSEGVRTTPSPLVRRGRRGRLSLHRSSSVTESEITPVGRMPLSANHELLTRSAPVHTKAGRGRQSIIKSRSPQSSPHTPRGGILASTLGIDLSAGNHSMWSPNKGSPDPLPAKPLVKRRLFSASTDQTSTPTKSNKKTTPLPGSRRKRLNSDSDALEQTVRSPPVLAHFEESAQFVFIPPKSENSRKRRRTMTTHQKERFDEQRDNYVPVTYTELDTSQQSWVNAAGGGSDSQSGSQSQISQPSWDQFRTALQDRLATNIVTPSSGTVGQEPRLSTQSSTSESVCGTENKFQPDCILATEAVHTNHDEVPMDIETNPTNLETLATSDPNETLSAQETQNTNNAKVIEKCIVLSDKPQQPDSPAQSTSADAPASDSPPESMTLPPPETLTPPNTPQCPTAEDSLASNTTPTSYLRKLAIGLRPFADTNASVPPVLSLSRPTSPLIRNMGSSRAQRMLVLGLKKAAEQTARQKPLSDNVLSDTNSPERTAPASPLSAGMVYQMDQTGSPSGILRNLWSRKKAQRVSFADQPVVFTIGRASQSPTDVDSSLRIETAGESEIPPRGTAVLQDVTGSILNAGPSEAVVDDHTAASTISESPSNLDLAPSPILTESDKSSEAKYIEVDVGSRRLSLPLFTRVDLDSSQCSSDGTPLRANDTGLSAFPLESSPRHRRKSASPQRCIVPVRGVPVLTAGNTVSSKSSVNIPLGRRFRLPKRRQLFTTDAPLPEPEATISIETMVPNSVVPDTEPEDYQLPSEVTRDSETNTGEFHSAALVPDSEAMVIADTQETEPLHHQTEIRSEEVTGVTLNNEDPDEQVDHVDTVIESSQDDEMSVSAEQPNSMKVLVSEQTELPPSKPPAQLVTEALQSPSPPEKISNANQPSPVSVIRVCSPDSDGMLEQISTEKDDHHVSVEPAPEMAPDTVDGLDDRAHDKNDVEAQIRTNLAEIASKLADLPTTRHQAVLMDVLSTFKSLMH
ncbi:hypothetical protein D915_007233 [Fasciola hepatica]|uniref:Uncharacterized protein n=1 Tax=Fasciola hepatica TaxID=6192 RepID=A0A4E0R1S5_FASHE|nr:hypothetical protein D915_007233 [Fasciola hepatica]